MLTIMQDPGFTKNASLGTYIVYYNPSDLRNLNLATDPKHAQAARTTIIDYLGFPIPQSYTNLQNTLTFARAEVDQMTTTWAKKKTAQPGNLSCFEFQYQGETYTMSLCMASDTYKTITAAVLGPGE